MTRKLLFINQWTPIGYSKLMTYFKYMLQQFRVPFVELEKVSDIERFVEKEKISCGLVVHSFDMIAEHGFPTYKNIKYLGLFVDPLDNIDHYFRMHGNDQNVFGSIVPFMMQHDYFRGRWPDKPVFSFYQGYVPYEDFDEDVVPLEKDIDVLAPGFNRDVPDRRRVIQELRQRGLNVVDTRLFGADLDLAMRRAKTSIYYPLFEHIRTFHGQRTLWAINKQTCFVALESGDTKCEEFYRSMGDIYVRIQDRDIPRFSDRVADIVKSGAWKTLGQQQYETYKQKYNGVAIFDTCLLKFLKDFTSTQDIVNPMDDKYRTYITKSTQQIRFDTTACPLQIPSLPKDFDHKHDVVLTTKLYQPWDDVNYELVDISNGSLNMSLLDLQYKLQNQKIKIILVKHQYGVMTDMKTIHEFLHEYEIKHGYRPVVIEIDRENKHPHEEQITKNYQYLLDEMDEMIQQYSLSIQLSFSDTKICSPKFPLLFLDEKIVDKFVNHLRAYNIECEINQEVVAIPCDQSVTEEQLDYVLDVMEEFFELNK